MNAIITLSDAKKHLNVDSYFTDDDELITSYIAAATKIVMADTNREEADLYNPDQTVNEIVRSAVLLKLGDLYGFREGSQTGTMNAVPQGYEHLCQLLRKYD